MTRKEMEKYVNKVLPHHDGKINISIHAFERINERFSGKLPNQLIRSINEGLKELKRYNKLVAVGSKYAAQAVLKPVNDGFLVVTVLFGESQKLGK